MIRDCHTMFRRLAALEAFDTGQQQQQYNQDQAYHYNTYLPNLIPTQSSYPAPQALRSALQNVNPLTGAATDVVSNPERLFRPTGPGQTLQQLQQACLAGSLDGLVGSQDPARKIRCGWMYTPPIPGSPIAQVSQGFLGTAEGPLPSLNNTTAYQTWFWDLQQAQKQVRTDTCKSLKNCGDVGSDLYNGCGYCTDIGQGIPVDGNGNPLYNDSPLTRCSQQNIVLQGSSCPPPPPAPPGPSPQPATCTPNAAGQLSASCLEQVLGQAGCADQGALSLALSSGATPTDYMATARTLPSMLLYNQKAPTTFNIAMYSQGQATVAQALAEARQLATNATQPPTSALGAAARDLCLQKGAINAYDFCADLVDSSPINAVDPSCLQKVFLRGGGTPDGTMFPSATNSAALAFFNSLGTWGAFKTYVANLYGFARGPSTQEGFYTQRTGSRYGGKTSKGAKRAQEGFTTSAYDAARQAYQQQSQALTQLRGITPDQLSNNRVPLVQGVEVFSIASINGLTTVVGYAIVPYIGAIASSAIATYGTPTAIYAISDYRTTIDHQYQFSLSSFPTTASINEHLWLVPASTDMDGAFQSQTTGSPTSCWSLAASTPNILRLYTSNPFSYTETFCPSQGPIAATSTYSLTKEAAGPILMYELDPATTRATFRELRSSDALPINAINISFNSTSDALIKSPGNNGYVTIPGGYTSGINIQNLSFGLWSTCTFVFRTNAAALGNTLFAFNPNPGGAPPSFCMYLMNDNQLYYFAQTPSGLQPPTPSGIILQQGTWYMCVVNKADTVFSVTVVPLSVAQSSATDLTAFNPATTFRVTTSAPLLVPNPLVQCLLKLGDGPVGVGSGIQASPLFTWDVAWWHFFATTPSQAALNRDALNNWMLTTPPQ